VLVQAKYSRNDRVSQLDSKKCVDPYCIALPYEAEDRRNLFAHFSTSLILSISKARHDGMVLHGKFDSERTRCHQ